MGRGGEGRGPGEREGQRKGREGRGEVGKREGRGRAGERQDDPRVAFKGGGVGVGHLSLPAFFSRLLGNSSGLMSINVA